MWTVCEMSSIKFRLRINKSRTHVKRTSFQIFNTLRHQFDSIEMKCHCLEQFSLNKRNGLYGWVLPPLPAFKRCQYTSICLKNCPRAKDTRTQAHTCRVCFELLQVKFIKLSPETINILYYYIHVSIHSFIHLLVWFMCRLCAGFFFTIIFYPQWYRQFHLKTQIQTHTLTFNGSLSLFIYFFIPWSSNK